METIFMNTENSKMNEPHKVVLDFSQRLDLRNLNKLIALLNLSIYYMWKNIRRHYKNGIKRSKKRQYKKKAVWNDEFGLPHSSYFVSYIQEYIERIIKKHKTLTTIPLIHVQINRINNRLVFKIKDRYKLELQTPETMKLFGSTKSLIDKTKNGENVPSHEVFEVVSIQCNLVDDQSVQCNLVDDQYQQKSNKSYAYLLNAEPSNLVFLKTYNT